MAEHTPLIATIVAGIGLAFLFGAIAQRLRISLLVGYLLAGIAVGPHSPGFVADPDLARELAEISADTVIMGEREIALGMIEDFSKRQQEATRPRRAGCVRMSSRSR